MSLSGAAKQLPVGGVLAAVLALTLSAAVTGFLDPLALLITVGGASAVTWATFSRPRLVSTLRHVAEALDEGPDPEVLIAELKQLARAQRLGGAPEVERYAPNVSDPFLRRAVPALLEARDTTELEGMLTGEMRGRIAEAEAARHVVLTLGKLFPAFGLIGTLLGLVVLLRSLDGASFVTMSGALGHAVLTTLYGAILSNVCALPLATKLQSYIARRAVVMEMVVAGLLLVRREEYPTTVERVLRAWAAAPLALDASAPSGVEHVAMARHAA